MKWDYSIQTLTPTIAVARSEPEMGYPLRHIPEGGALVEITVSTIQGRYLLRPDERGRVNELVLGVIGRAQELYSMSIVGIAVLR